MESSARRSPQMQAFGQFLRTGRLPAASIGFGGEHKFNPWHDPEDGRFTDSLNGSASLSGASKKPSAGPAIPVAKPSQTPKPVPTSATLRSRTASPQTEPRGWRKGGDLPPAEIDRRADHAMIQYQENRRRGMRPEEAAAWAANSEIESRGDHRSIQDQGGPGRGLFQWGPAQDPKYDRRKHFREVMGVPIEQSTREQQFTFRDWELQNTEKQGKSKIDAAMSAGDKAFAISLHYLRPGSKGLTATSRANLAEAILRRGLAKRKRVRQQSRASQLHCSVFLPAVY